MLGERLGKVRGWVEGVERGEREWGGRVRMRLRVLAGMLVAVLVLVVLLHGWRFYIVGAGVGGGGDGRLSASGDIFGGGAGAGAGGDVLRKRWNNMNLGAAERGAMPREKKMGGSSISSTCQSVTITTPSVGWQVLRGEKGENSGGGRMRKRWDNMNLGAAERVMSSSSRGKKEGGSSSSSSSSSTVQNSVTLTPNVEWQELTPGDDDDEDPRLRVFDEL